MRTHYDTDEWTMFEEALDGEHGNLDLSELYKSAIVSKGTKLKSAEISPGRRGTRFSITIDLPGWARDHVERMNKEAEEAALKGAGAPTLPEYMPSSRGGLSLAEKWALLKSIMEDESKGNG